MTQALSLHGVVMGAGLDTSPNVMGVIYNKDLVEQYASHTDLQALYEQGDWKFNAFRALAAAVTRDLDGDQKTDLYGVTSNTNLMDMTLYAHSGGVARLVDGKVKGVGYSEAARQGYFAVREMFNTDGSWLYKADITQCISEFAKGRAAMFVSYAQYLEPIARQSDFDLGFLPFPKTGDGDYYYGNVFDGTVYVIPVGKEQMVNTLCGWLKALSPVREELLTQKAESYRQLGLSEDGVQAWLAGAGNLWPDYSKGVLSGALTDGLDIALNPTISLKTWEARREQLQQELDEYYAVLTDGSDVRS